MYGALLALSLAGSDEHEAAKPTFGRFLDDLDRGQVQGVVLETSDNSARVTAAGDREYTVGYPPDWGAELIARLERADVGVDVKPSGQSTLAMVLRILLPVALLVALVWFIVRRSRGGGVIGAFRRAPRSDRPKTGRL